MTNLAIGQFVKITGGVSAKGKVGQISELDDPDFAGVRVPNIQDATETVYVTLGSIEPLAHEQLTETKEG